MPELVDTYGIMLTVHQLAKGNILDMDRVIWIEAETFYYFLSMEKSIAGVWNIMNDIEKRKRDFEALNNKARE